MILALLLIVSGVEDPRPELIQLQLEGKNQVALERVDQSLADNREVADRWGLEYLRGHLLERLENEHEAVAAFATALTVTPTLASYSRYRLALSQLQMGHPEVAAGLLATLLADDPPPSLVPTAVRFLLDSLALGGDCRLLREVEAWRLPRDQSRPIKLTQSLCAWRSGNFQQASDLATELLRQSREDEPARGAAVLLSDLVPKTADSATLLRIGLTFHHHREFERAVPFLDRGIAAINGGNSGLSGVDRADALYSLARSYFWLADYPKAAAIFSEVALEENSSSRRTRAYFQQGRCWELHGDWPAASRSYHQAFAITPTSTWTSAAILSAMRVEWLRGSETTALELLTSLRSRGDWKSMASRGLLFLAVSDIVRDRSDQATDWLEAARRSMGSNDIEIAFWRGRLAELENNNSLAVQRYATVLAEDTYHPLGIAARKRLDGVGLVTATQDEGRRLAASERNLDLYKAWLLLGSADPAGARARDRVFARWENNSQLEPFLSSQWVAPADWPIWKSTPDRPEDLLLKLGVVEQMSPTLRSHFPRGDTSYALTGSRFLSTAGLHQPSLYLAEVAGKRLPEDVPTQLLPLEYRRLLYPQPYQSIVVRESKRQEVDPNLLNAIIREESRFNPLAVSAASARGLTQFVLPTARSVSRSLGWRRLEAVDLHRPEVAIALAAAYLAELESLFEDRVEVAISAYNAGENQARLWASYCYGREPEEYFSKVGFTQTRNYLRKVDSSRAQYQEIYSQSNKVRD